MHPTADRVLQRSLAVIGLIALALALFTLPVSLTVRYTATSASWWERGFERYDATHRTGLPQEEVLRVADETRAYLSNDDEQLTVQVEGQPFYTEREVLHMIDVKRLMNRTYDAGWAALGFIIAYVTYLALRYRSKAAELLARTTLRACGVVAAVVIVLAIVAVAGFESAFRQFHLLFFTNDLWQLSSSDGLIQLFPQRFFFDTTLLIGGVTFALMLAVSAASAIVLRRQLTVARDL